MGAEKGRVTTTTEIISQERLVPSLVKRGTSPSHRPRKGEKDLRKDTDNDTIVFSRPVDGLVRTVPRKTETSRGVPRSDHPDGDSLCSTLIGTVSDPTLGPSLLHFRGGRTSEKEKMKRNLEIREHPIPRSRHIVSFLFHLRSQTVRAQYL